MSKMIKKLHLRGCVKFVLCKNFQFYSTLWVCLLVSAPRINVVCGSLVLAAQLKLQLSRLAETLPST